MVRALALWALLSVCVWAASGEASAQTAEDRCVARAERALERCEVSCKESESCLRRCDRTFESAEAACFEGSSATGEQGCYFGKCPEDEEESPPERPRQRTADRDPTPLPQTPVPTPAQRWGTICMTQYGNCPMNLSAGLVGAPCYCTGVYGTVWGIAQ
jgi:hypothetical protein